MSEGFKRELEMLELRKENERLRSQLVAKNEHLNWIRGYANLMTPDNWRDMQLRIERQVDRALIDEQRQPPAPEQTRWPIKGDWMKFLGQNGYDHELEEALKIFTVGREYLVHDCNVQSWSHSIQFNGVRGWYNGVMFELVSQTSAICREERPMKKPKPKPTKKARKVKKVRKPKQRPTPRDHEFNPEDVAFKND